MIALDVDSAHHILNSLAVLLLATALWSILVRRLDSSIRLLGLQGLLLAAAAAVVALSSGTAHAYVAVVITLAIKAVAVPGILLFALREVKLKREVEMALSRRFAFPLAIGLVLVAYDVVAPLETLDGLLAHEALPAAVAMLLIGLFNMLIRKKALSQIIGIVAMENGLYLMAVVATSGLPLAVELGVAADLVTGVLVMSMYARQIHRTFNTINTDRLRTLRG
ncbi:MAG: hypothetical protein EPO21_17675 [Chloroflexota bacterium]|nr:MAG: hypothetical protein EPO21_17675 [Chloroflexota bacterium]